MSAETKRAKMHGGPMGGQYTPVRTPPPDVIRIPRPVPLAFDVSPVPPMSPYIETGDYERCRCPHDEPHYSWAGWDRERWPRGR